MTRTASKPRQVPALACAVLLSCATGAWAQEVSVATLQNVPADTQGIDWNEPHLVCDRCGYWICCTNCKPCPK